MSQPSASNWSKMFSIFLPLEACNGTTFAGVWE
jgi:hypothetical protein